MLNAAKSLLKESLFVQRTYRRYIQPHLPQYEPETFILRGMKFDQCVDVGAHAGTFSILLSANSNRVYAFEPSEHSFNILRNLNIENMTAFNLALGSENEEMDISLPVVEGEIDYALATLRSITSSDYEKMEKQKVRVIRFDDLKRDIDFNHIDFVKIDVEGFELSVVLGMSELIATKKPSLLIEIEQRHNPEYLRIFEYLGKVEYAPFITSDGISMRELDVAELPNLQSPERLASDTAKKFRIGECKNYINNIFFLQPEHKSKFPLKGTP